MTMLCELCLPLVRVGGVFAAMKGPEPEEEVQEAARCIRTLGGGKPRIEKYTVPGTDAVHSVVIIPKIAPTPAKYPRRFAMIKSSRSEKKGRKSETSVEEVSLFRLSQIINILPALCIPHGRYLRENVSSNTPTHAARFSGDGSCRARS